MGFLFSQLLFILFGLIGLIAWASSDMPLVMREIALNTRKEREGGSSYVLVRVLSICLKVLAVVLWVLGIVSIVAINAAGAMGGLFESF